MKKNVTEWLDESASKFSSKIAVTDEHESVTFAEYRSRALAVARAIIALGHPAKLPVVICLPKSASELVAFAAAAYAGDFYSPVDVDMPEARAKKIIEILAPTIAVTDAGRAAFLRAVGFKGDILLIEDIRPSADDDKVVLPVRDRAIDTDLLYVLFTSGSTGMPKGACIAHRSIIDYIEWLIRDFGISDNDSFANQAAFSFDMSVLEIFSSLASGASLFVPSHELFSQPIKLLEYIRDNRINTISWVPSALIFIALSKALGKIDLNGVLKRVFFCGEVMPCRQLNIWRSYLPDCLYVNFYGPTEATHACSYYVIDREFLDSDSLPIGRAMSNEDIMVLGENGLIGHNDCKSVGELCVRGSCLALGYYRAPEKTRESFVQNPLNEMYDEKIYRTGDLVKYNDRGELIYVGRKDFQIKHAGYRIELGEIEVAAASIDGVASCCCLYDDAKGRITLFIEGNFVRGEIRQKLSPMLPPYMLPHRVICLDSMPLTPNRKVDRVKLKGMM